MEEVEELLLSFESLAGLDSLGVVDGVLSEEIDFSGAS